MDARRIARLFLTGWLRPALIVAIVVVLYVGGALQFLDYRLMDLAFRAIRRDAGGAIVLVTIDPDSLKRVGVWPWPRRHYATVLQRLRDAAAARVTLALDFSSRTTPEDDSALAAALSAAGPVAVLPVFRQAVREGDTTQVADTAPMPEFASHAILASANLVPSSDARIRSYATRADHAGSEIPTVAATLAPATAKDDFFIDYGIDPKSIPAIPFVDVLNGDFDRTLVRGRAVIVGATAIELGSNLPVPVYQTLPSSVVQALAAESLRQGRAIQASSPLLVLGLVLVLAFSLAPAFARGSWQRGLAVCIVSVAGVLLVSLGLHAFAIFLAPMPLVLVCVLSYGASLASQIDTQARRVYMAAMAAAHKTALARKLVDHSFDAIFVVDRDGLVQSFNPAAERMFGYESDAVKGMSVAALLDQSDNVGLLRPGYPVFLSAGLRELVGRRHDGSPFPVEVSVTVVPLRSGRHKLERRTGDRTALICTARDITERKSMETALRTAHREAEEASRAKTELISNMSHELRTPLNAIIGFSEMMDQRVFGDVGHPRYADYARQIGESGRLLLRIISDILDLSSLEARRFVLNEGRVDPEEALRACIAQFDELAQKRSITVDARLPAELPTLRADPVALRQALCALVSNAIKFNRQGGVVTVSATVSAEALTITIADNGIGIPAESIERLMQPFERLESSLSRRFEGTGLGLPLARALFALHDASLTLTSTPGNGTVATVVFDSACFSEPFAPSRNDRDLEPRHDTARAEADRGPAAVAARR